MTKARNLRCFPCCGPVHMEKSFCGSSVSLLVQNLPKGYEKAVIVAEIVSIASNVRIGDQLSENSLDNSNHGKLVRCFDGQDKFVINPSRKWASCPGRQREMNRALVCYLVLDKIVKFILKSDSFRVEYGKPDLTGLTRLETTVSRKRTEQEKALEVEGDKQVYKRIQTASLLSPATTFHSIPPFAPPPQYQHLYPPRHNLQEQKVVPPLPIVPSPTHPPSPDSQFFHPPAPHSSQYQHQYPPLTVDPHHNLQEQKLLPPLPLVPYPPSPHSQFFHPQLPSSSQYQHQYPRLTVDPHPQKQKVLPPLPLVPSYPPSPHSQILYPTPPLVPSYPPSPHSQFLHPTPPLVPSYPPSPHSQFLHPPPSSSWSSGHPTLIYNTQYILMGKDHPHIRTTHTLA